MKILAIDDLADNLVSLSALLRTFLPGCETETAQSGKEGIEKARISQPDTILLDVQMPGMDGFEVCRVLKKDPVTCHIPVIFLTAQNTDSASRIRGLKVGGDAFLSKPVDPGELMAQVKAMVRIKQSDDRLRGESHLLEQMVARRTAALESSESRLRLALDGASDGLWDVQMKTGEVYLSPRGCEILGYTPEELPQVAQVWTQLVHPDDMPRTMERLTAHIEGRAPLFQVEQRLRMKSGEWKWVLTRGKVVARDAKGNPLRMTGTHTDISERKRAEEELKRRNAFIETLLENAPIGFAVNTIHDGKPVYVSGNFEKIYGVAPGSLENVADFFEEVYLDPVFREEIRARIMSDMATGDASRMRWENIPITTRAGEEKVVTAINIPLLDQDLMISTVQDVTERRCAEETLAAQLDELRQWHEATLGREMRVLELKREVNELLTEVGRPRRYLSAEADRDPEDSVG